MSGVGVLDPIPRPSDEEIISGWPYQTKDCVLLPLQNTALFQFPEDFLVSLYYRMVAQDLLRTFLPGMPGMNLYRFVKYFADKPMVVSLGKPKYNVAGIGWIYESDGRDGCRKAGFGFGFFRESWGKQLVRDSANLALDWWFTGLKIDVLFGVTLASNRLASNFAKNLGFTHVGVLPRWFVTESGFEDARLVTLTKDQFLGRRQHEQGSR